MAGNRHHEPLKALGPVDWTELLDDQLDDLSRRLLTEAQLVVDSIPLSTPAWTTARDHAAGRARAKTDPAPAAADVVNEASRPAFVVDGLRDEWSEVKVNARDNPLGIRVYKLAAKDGQGSWFARRSVHHGLAFDRWRRGLQSEFPETMKVQGSPGSGNIRGIGADKSVEQRVLDGGRHLSVFQLSAQFPGPTAPRDFVTLLLTSDASTTPTDGASPLRQYTIVSKPCTHPECPPRQGIIRGRYESVEVIREIPSESLAGKRSLSHGDLVSDEGRADGAPRTLGGPSPDTDGPPRAIEWLMVTRSDPGGSVPRFMIDKGTPPGIVGDAGKFLHWAASVPAEGGADARRDGAAEAGDIQPPPPQGLSREPVRQVPVGEKQQDDAIPSSNGLYGIIAGAFGVASSVASGLRQQLGGPLGLESGGSRDTAGQDRGGPDGRGDGSDSDSDSSSTCSFASAVEKAKTGGDCIVESHSDASSTKLPVERQLQKLMERRRRLEDDFAKTQERLESKRQGEMQRDSAALAKAREKHERELAKHEAKFRRETKKLEEKREHQERKAEQRRRKTLEKEHRSVLSAELEGVKAERDVAVKKLELLQRQVGELQAQNTMLVAKLGRLGASGKEDSSSSREASIKSLPPS